MGRIWIVPDVHSNRGGDGGAWREAAAAGVDMELLEATMRLSPTQRLHRHEQALALADVLSRGKIQRDERSE